MPSLLSSLISRIIHERHSHRAYAAAFPRWLTLFRSGPTNGGDQGDQLRPGALRSCLRHPLGLEGTTHDALKNHDARRLRRLSECVARA